MVKKEVAPIQLIIRDSDTLKELEIGMALPDKI
jgi:hypothetical protein